MPVRRELLNPGVTIGRREPVRRLGVPDRKPAVSHPPVGGRSRLFGISGIGWPDEGKTEFGDSGGYASLIERSAGGAGVTRDLQLLAPEVDRGCAHIGL